MGGSKGPTVHDAITEDLALGRAQKRRLRYALQAGLIQATGDLTGSAHRSLDCPKILPECIDNPNRK